MSDLCHNCGQCHLPRPCQRALVRCEICQDMGHQFAFCPTSVLQRVPNYTYWALCHNCQIWHLPHPCRQPRYICRICKHGGHQEAFCPVQPYRDPLVFKHTPTSAGDMNATGAMPDTNILKFVRVETTKQVFSMLQMGYTPDKILEFVARPVKLTPKAWVPASNPGLGSLPSRPLQNPTVQPQDVLKGPLPVITESQARAQGLITLPASMVANSHVYGPPAQAYNTPPAWNLPIQPPSQPQDQGYTAAIPSSEPPHTPVEQEEMEEESTVQESDALSSLVEDRDDMEPQYPQVATKAPGMQKKRKRCAGCAIGHKKCTHNTVVSEPSSESEVKTRSMMVKLKTRKKPRLRSPYESPTPASRDVHSSE